MDKNLAHAKTLLLPTKNSQATSRESDSHVIRPSTLQPREIYATVDRAKYFFRSRCCHYHLLHFRVGRNSKALVHRLNRKKWVLFTLGQPVTKCFSAKYQEVQSVHYIPHSWWSWEAPRLPQLFPDNPVDEPCKQNGCHQQSYCTANQWRWRVSSEAGIDKRHSWTLTDSSKQQSSCSQM